MKTKNSMIMQTVLRLIQGALVGAGALLPGISGGVLCVAFGVYEPMMELLTHPIAAARKHARLFLPFVLGWALGFTLLAKVIELLFAASATVTLMLFFGLICGTVPALFTSTVESDPHGSWTPFVLSTALAYLFFHILEHSVTTVVPPSFPAFLFCGFLWGLSLIVPGLSSSSTLICLGLFEPLTAGIAAFDPAVLLPMVLGIVLTTLLFARLVHMLFGRYPAVMSRTVLGFVIASALQSLPANLSTPRTWLLSLVCFALGFAAARWMDVLGEHQQTK